MAKKKSQGNKAASKLFNVAGVLGVAFVLAGPNKGPQSSTSLVAPKPCFSDVNNLIADMARCGDRIQTVAKSPPRVQKDTPTAAQLVAAEERRLEQRLKRLHGGKGPNGNDTAFAANLKQNMAMFKQPEELAKRVLKPQQMRAFGRLEPQQQLDMLAHVLTAYHEARGEGEIGLAAVSQTLHNRGDGFEEALRFRQFSFWGELTPAQLADRKQMNKADEEMLDLAIGHGSLHVLGNNVALHSGFATVDHFAHIQLAEHVIGDSRHYVNVQALGGRAPGWAERMKEQGAVEIVLGNHTYFSPPEKDR